MTIARPRDSVWRQLITLDGFTDWYGNWDSCEHEPGELRLREGLSFRLHSARALQASARCRVVTLVEPSLVRWIERRPLHAPLLVGFRLTADTPDSTVVTHSKTAGRLRRAGRST